MTGANHSITTDGVDDSGFPGFCLVVLTELMNIGLVIFIKGHVHIGYQIRHH